MNNILIIGAHYDDVELGCGGTAAKLISEGKKVYKITLTDNVTDFKQMNVRVEYEKSVGESHHACECLGIVELEFEPEPCTKLTYSKELMQRIENIIYSYDIDTVFIHFDSDVQQDHVEASRMCLTAARHCDNILMYQSNIYILNKPFYPTYFVDISEHINEKIEALRQYGEEHNRFSKLFQTIIERNHIWGSENHVEYAEGFHVVKMLIR